MAISGSPSAVRRARLSRPTTSRVSAASRRSVAISNGAAPAGCCGPIFALNAQTGEVAWQFDAIGTHEGSRDASGGGPWPPGAGSGWTTGTFDRRTNSVWWGAAQPAHGLAAVRSDCRRVVG